MGVGELKVSEPEPYNEQYWENSYGGTVAQGVYTNLYMGTFTMPWAGYAVGEWYLEYYHPGWQHVQWGLAPCSPTPSNYPEFAKLKRNQFGGNLWSVIPAMARWAFLNSGQTVTVTCRVYTGGGPVTNIERIYGSVRMYRDQLQDTIP
jgi:hypothetical protein